MGSLGLFVAWMVCIVGASALLHEFGHAWTARAVGWKLVGLRWRWYGLAYAADVNGKPEHLWKVALGGPSMTAALALCFLAGTALPDPAPSLFRFGFTLNVVLLLISLVPIRELDGGQLLSGIRKPATHPGLKPNDSSSSGRLSESFGRSDCRG